MTHQSTEDQDQGYSMPKRDIGIVALIVVILVGTALLSGCGTIRNLTQINLPVPPIDCEKVLTHEVRKFPKGKTTDQQISIWLAKEGTLRKKEQEEAKVCAQHAIDTYKALQEKQKPTS